MRLHIPSGVMKDHLKLVGFVWWGVVLGLMTMSSWSGIPELPILGFVVLGLLAASPFRERRWDDLVGRGALALGLVSVGTFLLSGGQLLAGGVTVIAAMVLAVGSDGRHPWEHFVRVAVLFVALGGALVSAGIALRSWPHQGLSDANLIWATVFAVLLGSAAFLATLFRFDHESAETVVDAKPETVSNVSTEPRSAKTTVKPVKAVSQRRSVAQPVTPATTTTDDDVPILFGPEFTELRTIRARIDALLDAMTEASPAVEGFTDQIRRSIDGTMNQAQASISRWRVVQASEPTKRAVELADRLEGNQTRLDEATGDSVRRQIELTIAQQQKTLAALERMSTRRVAFEYRLQQVRSGLELLELAIERALIDGQEIDSTEVEAIVDAMNEGEPVFDDVSITAGLH